VLISQSDRQVLTDLILRNLKLIFIALMQSYPVMAMARRTGKMENSELICHCQLFEQKSFVNTGNTNYNKKVFCFPPEFKTFPISIRQTLNTPKP